jgi:hypothetical protein
MDRADAIDRLIAKDEIVSALMRYCRGIDRRDEQLVRSVYHEDAVDEHGFGQRASGWELAARVDVSNGDSFPAEWEATQHLIANILVEVDGDRAASEAYFAALIRFSHDGRRYDNVASGRYLDCWERRGGPFRIVHRNVVYDHIRTDEVLATWPGPDTEVPKMRWGGAELPSVEALYGEPGPDDLSYCVLANASASTSR